MRIYIFIAMLSFPFFLNAQIEIGFRAGANMAEADLQRLYDKPFELESMRGIQASLFANFQLGSSFALQPEISYSQKGFEASWNNADSSYTLRTNYFEVPLMLEFGIPIGKNLRIFGNAGPNASYLFNAKEEFFDNVNETFSITDYNFQEENMLERLDLGVNFGGGISVRINRWKIMADARYNIGLLSLIEVDSANNFFETAKNKVTNIAIGASYTLIGNKNTFTPAPTTGGNYY